jgi:hypothetical protein
MFGSPPPFENRAVTRDGVSCMCAAFVSPLPLGVNVPVSSVPFACAARCPGWVPEIAPMASTTSSADVLMHGP